MTERNRELDPLAEAERIIKAVQSPPDETVAKMCSSLFRFRQDLPSHPAFNRPRWLELLFGKPATLAVVSASIIALCAALVLLPSSQALAKSRDAMLRAQNLVCHAQITHAPNETLFWTMHWAEPDFFRINYESDNREEKTVHWIVADNGCMTLVTDESGRHAYSSVALPTDLDLVRGEMGAFLQNSFLGSMLDGLWEQRSVHSQDGNKRVLYQRENTDCSLMFEVEVDEASLLPVFYHIIQRQQGETGNVSKPPLCFTATFHLAWNTENFPSLLPDRLKIKAVDGVENNPDQTRGLRRIDRALGFLREILAEQP